MLTLACHASQELDSSRLLRLYEIVEVIRGDLASGRQPGDGADGADGAGAAGVGETEAPLQVPVTGGIVLLGWLGLWVHAPHIPTHDQKPTQINRRCPRALEIIFPLSVIHLSSLNVDAVIQPPDSAGCTNGVVR